MLMIVIPRGRNTFDDNRQNHPSEQIVNVIDVKVVDEIDDEKTKDDGKGNAVFFMLKNLHLNFLVDVLNSKIIPLTVNR